MKAITCAVIALVCVVGIVVADFGYGGYAQYVPIHPGYGSKGGFGNGGRKYTFYVHDALIEGFICSYKL